jgi:hypothetical protein
VVKKGGAEKLYYIVCTITEKADIERLMSLTEGMSSRGVVSMMFDEHPCDGDPVPYTEDEINNHARENKQFFVRPFMSSRCVALPLKDKGGNRIDMIVQSDRGFIF